MAELEIRGMSTLIKDMENIGGSAEKLSQLTSRTTTAMADVIEGALKQSARSLMHVHSGDLVESIRKSRGMGKRSGRIIVGPSGVHHTYRAIGGGNGQARAGHVGYVLEYGAPDQGIMPRHWVSMAVARYEPAALDAGQKAFDDFFKQNY